MGYWLFNTLDGLKIEVWRGCKLYLFFNPLDGLKIEVWRGYLDYIVKRIQSRHAWVMLPAVASGTQHIYWWDWLKPLYIIHANIYLLHVPEGDRREHPPQHLFNFTRIGKWVGYWLIDGSNMQYLKSCKLYLLYPLEGLKIEVLRGWYIDYIVI